MSIDAIIEDFAFLDDWEDRYRYVIELGRALPSLDDTERTDANKVRGCASQVWIVSEIGVGGDPEIIIRGESDAHIVRGLIAILLELYSGQTASRILEIDPEAQFEAIGLREHLTAQRSNGLTSMVSRIRHDAESALAAGKTGTK